MAAFADSILTRGTGISAARSAGAHSVTSDRACGPITITAQRVRDAFLARTRDVPGRALSDAITPPQFESRTRIRAPRFLKRQIVRGIAGFRCEWRLRVKAVANADRAPVAGALRPQWKLTISNELACCRGGPTCSHSLDRQRLQCARHRAARHKTFPLLLPVRQRRGCHEQGSSASALTRTTNPYDTRRTAS
jgi:hypothetical protein